MQALDRDCSYRNRIPVVDDGRTALNSIPFASHDRDARDLGRHGIVPSCVIAVFVGGEDFRDGHSLVARRLQNLSREQGEIVCEELIVPHISV